MPSLKFSAPDYQAFHPPLIRLQQTSPRPQGQRVLWVLLALLVFLLMWAVAGRLDIVAVDDGKLVPDSYLKPAAEALTPETQQVLRVGRGTDFFSQQRGPES